MIIEVYNLITTDVYSYYEDWDTPQISPSKFTIYLPRSTT